MGLYEDVKGLGYINLIVIAIFIVESQMARTSENDMFPKT